MIKHFKNHAEARAEHERFGGVLLIEGNNLAPSWDESHPDNVGRRITDKDQGELF